MSDKIEWNQDVLFYMERCGRRFKLATPAFYEIGLDTYTVPAGFVTDFASIPRLFHRLVPKLGAYNWAAILHDYLYTAEGQKKYGLNRLEADQVFRNAMTLDGVGPVNRWLIYRAVRLAGWRWFAHA